MRPEGSRMSAPKRILLRVLMIGFLGTSTSACTTSSEGGRGGGAAGVAPAERIRIFAVANFEDLKVDMARGRGEHLTAFARLLAVPDEEVPEFSAFTQEKFSILYPSQQVTAEAMVATLTRELANAPQIHSLIVVN